MAMAELAKLWKKSANSAPTHGERTEDEKKKKRQLAFHPGRLYLYIDIRYQRCWQTFRTLLNNEVILILII